MTLVWINSHAQLFWLHGPWREWISQYVAIKRIMWRGGRPEVILECRLPESRQFIKECSLGELHIVHKEYGIPTDYVPEAVIMRFYDLHFKHRWILDATVFSSDDVRTLAVYLHLACSIWEKPE